MDAITEHHYKNIATGKAKPLDDGDLATVRTIIVEIDGVETLIPTIWDGEEVDDRTAIKFAQDSGVDWPTRTGSDAVAELQAFDEQIHLEMTDQTTPQEAARILSEKAPSFNKGGLMSGTAAYDNAALLDKEIAEAEAAGISQEPPTAAQLGSLALDFTPIIGDLKGGYETAVEISNELEKENPDYAYIGLLAGAGTAAALVGLVPGLGDAAGKAIMNGAKSVADKMPEYDPNTVGMFGGNMFAKGADTPPANSPDKPNIISFTDKKEQKKLTDFRTGFMSDIKRKSTEMSEFIRTLKDSGIYDGYEIGAVVQGKNIKGDPLPFTIEGLSLTKTRLDSSLNKSMEERLGFKLNYIEKDGDYFIAILRTKQSDGTESTAYLDAVKALNYPVLTGPTGSVPTDPDKVEFALGGLAVARKGITTPEGLEMAEKTTQLDRKKADKNNDGKLSKYEETVGKAVQDAMVDDPEQDEKVLKFQSGGTPLNLSRSLPDTTGFLPIFVQESLSDAERHKMNVLGVVPPYILNLLTARELNLMPESLVSESLAAARRGPPTEGGVQEVMDKEGKPIERPDNHFEPEPFPYNYILPMMDRANLLPEKMSDKYKYPDRSPSQTAKPKMSHGGMATMGDYDCGMMSDPMPIGATESEVADDISAMISENEYVLPANVVKWHGLKHIMSLQDEAEMGLMMMQEQGLIQEVDNASADEEYEDHMMYDPESGEGKMTKSNEEHLDLKSKGWSHEGETQEPDSKGAENAQVSDTGDSEQEEKETIETPEGNEIEMAGVKTVIQEPEMDETEDYKLNDYGKSSQMFGVMKKPKFSFIM